MTARFANDDLSLKIQSTKLVTNGDHTFFTGSFPLPWNGRPYTLRTLDSFDTLKGRLKTHSFQEYLNWILIILQKIVSILCNTMNVITLLLL